MSATTRPDPLTAKPEEWADWCSNEGGVAFSGTRYKESKREAMGERWCFHCRKRHGFDYVLMVPDGLSYYDPYWRIEGVKADCTDLFPGWVRTWGEDE